MTTDHAQQVASLASLAAERLRLVAEAIRTGAVPRARQEYVAAAALARGVAQELDADLRDRAGEVR